jgi:hypothetical protein
VRVRRLCDIRVTIGFLLSNIGGDRLIGVGRRVVMKTRAKILLAGATALELALLLLLRPLVHRIDSAADARFEKAAIPEVKYGEMTNAYVLASEMAPDHPVSAVARSAG